MKKTTLLNAPISAVIATMGHFDRITIADCGLPIGGTGERIDLALKFGIPTFLDTLDTVLEELEVQRIVLAEEIKTANPEMEQEILKRFEGKAEIEYVPHTEFKKLTHSTKAIIRTGEHAPYSNIILESGCTF